MPSPSFHVQAHRGASAEALENSLPAFQAAIAARADSVELDVHLTSDGELAVYHDFKLAPAHVLTADGHPLREALTLRTMTWVEIERLRVVDPRRLRGAAAARTKFPDAETRIPNLASVFRLFRESSDPWACRMAIDIEIKSDPRHPQWSAPPDALAQAVLSLVDRNWERARTVVRSFDHRVLEALRRELGSDRTLAIAALTEKGFSDFATLARDLHPEIVAPEWRSLDRAMVELLHAECIRVIPWTVNSEVEWERLLGMGVDGATTDDPRALVTFLGAQGYSPR